MFTNRSTIPIKLGILLVGFGLLVVGCDSAGTSAEEEQDENPITFEAVDGLGDRITYFDGNSSSNAKTAAQKSTVAFSVESHVDPPDPANPGTERASHLAVSNPTAGSSPTNRNLYIGYKVRGDTYGGGVDIVDAPSGGTLSDPASDNGGDATALESPNVDVQELAVKEDGGDPAALYIATAVDPDASLPRAPQFHSIELRGNDGLPNTDFNSDSEELRVEGLTGNTSSNSPGAGTRVAKSVVAHPSSSSFEAYVLADTSMAYSVDTGSNKWEISDIASDETNIEFRSVTTTFSGNVYTLGLDGYLYQIDSGGSVIGSVSSSSLGTISNPGGFGDDDKSIARLNSHKFGNYGGAELLLVALNDGGFRIFDPASPPGTNGDVVFSDPDVYATDVEATDDYVYVASGQNLAVYEVEDSGLGNNTTDDGLDFVGQQSIEDMGGSASGFVTDAQINDILVDKNGSDVNLYIAKSDDGVFRLKQDNNGVW